jgi:hypothetical protein
VRSQPFRMSAACIIATLARLENANNFQPENLCSPALPVRTQRKIHADSRHPSVSSPSHRFFRASENRLSDSRWRPKPARQPNGWNFGTHKRHLNMHRLSEPLKILRSTAGRMPKPVRPRPGCNFRDRQTFPYAIP